MIKELDSSVIKNAQSGDHDAFTLIYNHYYKFVYAVCVRVINNEAIAEEITQDAFITLYRKINQFKFQSKFSSWLYRLAYNHVLMHLRRENKIEIVSIPEDVLLDDIFPYPRSFKPHLTVDLTNAIGNLPDGYRFHVIEHLIKGKEYKEIAELSNTTVGNSKSQLHKARKNLQKSLSSYS